jgi:hypothetical protein
MKGGFVWICYEIVDRKDVESGAALDQTGDGVANTILGKKPGGTKPCRLYAAMVL